MLGAGALSMLVACALVSCSLTSLDGFSSGAPADGSALTSDASSSDASSSGSSGSDASSSGSSGSDASSSGTSGSTGFFDDFNRPSGVIGNGWFEKTAGSFAIFDNQVVVKAATPNYRNDCIFRPFAEALSDFEASAVFRLKALSPGYVQLHVRVPQSSMTEADVSEGYSVYIPDDVNRGALFRQVAGDALDLENMPLSTPLTTTDRYRLRIRVTGTAPVMLEGWVERQDGASWNVLGHATRADSDFKRFRNAGTLKLCADTNDHVSYDDVSWQKL